MEEKYLPELMAEKDSLDPSFTHALRLVNQGEGARRRPFDVARGPWGPEEWRPGDLGTREGRDPVGMRGLEGVAGNSSDEGAQVAIGDIWVGVWGNMEHLGKA